MSVPAEITLRDAGEVTIWVGAVCAALVTIGGVLHLVVLRPLRNWMHDQLGSLSSSQDETAKRLETDNGTTIAQYVEGSAKTLQEIRDQLAQTNKLALQSNQLGLQTQRLALQNQEQLLEQSRRLDVHLLEHHPPPEGREQ